MLGARISASAHASDAAQPARPARSRGRSVGSKGGGPAIRSGGMRIVVPFRYGARDLLHGACIHGAAGEDAYRMGLRRLYEAAIEQSALHIGASGANVLALSPAGPNLFDKRLS